VCSSVQVYPLGSEADIELAVAVENRGEDAFEATVRIFTPSDVDYISVSDIAAPVSSNFTPQLQNYKHFCAYAVAKPRKATENKFSLQNFLHIY